MQVNLALCCKGMLPVLYKGFVSVRLDKPKGERPLSQLARCLSQQPDGVSHLKLFAAVHRRDTCDTCDLIDLRCVHALQPCWHGPGYCMDMAVCKFAVMAVLVSKVTRRELISVWPFADAVCCSSCASCPWTELHCPCRRCSQSPCGCNPSAYQTAACQAAQMAS